MIQAIEMSDGMFKAVCKATDILSEKEGKPLQNQNFILRATGLVLKSMGLAPKTGRPMGYRQRALAGKKSKKPARRKR